MYFKPNYKRRAPSGIFRSTEATAVSSKSSRLYLGHRAFFKMIFKSTNEKRRTRGFKKLSALKNQKPLHFQQHSSDRGRAGSVDMELSAVA
jgi:hypothetical protein